MSETSSHYALMMIWKDDFFVHQLWQQIGQPTIQRYVVSMRQRCLAVIRARVGLSPYLINRGVILCFKGVICQGHCFKVF